MRRVYIPKANGKLRPLGIPTIRDRVVQMAALLILGADLRGGLPGLFVRIPSRALGPSGLGGDPLAPAAGLSAVYDADLEGYFDSIPHDKLMLCRRSARPRLPL